MPKGLVIPEIESDQELIELIDELKHRIKGCIRKNGKYSVMQSDFNNALDIIIRIHNLNTDPHMFASAPKES